MADKKPKTLVQMVKEKLQESNDKLDAVNAKIRQRTREKTA